MLHYYLQNIVNSDNLEEDPSQSNDTKNSSLHDTSGVKEPSKNISDISNTNHDNTDGGSRASETCSSQEISNTTLPSVQLTRIHRYDLFNNILSNLPSSTITIVFLVLLIALLLYRRIFLL